MPFASLYRTLSRATVTAVAFASIAAVHAMVGAPPGCTQAPSAYALPAAMPAGAAALLHEAQDALARGDVAALQALGDRPDRLAWIGSKAKAQRIGWQVTAIALPAAPEVSSSEFRVPTVESADTGRARPPRRALPPRPPDARNSELGTRHSELAARCAVSTLNPQPSTYLAVFSAYHTCQSIGDHFLRLVPTAAGWRFGPEIAETDTLGYRVTDHDLRVTFDAARTSAAVNDNVTVERSTALVTNTTRLCILRLTSVMQLDSATMDGNALPVASAPGIIAFTAPSAARFNISLAYHGSYPMRPGVDNYLRTNETVMNAYWWPHIARLPAPATITVSVQNGWTADATGAASARQADPGVPGRAIFRWRNDVPICFLSLDTGAYSITSRLVAGRRLSVYQLRPNAARAEQALDRLQRALAFFEARFGPFPYSHYEMVESNGPFGGALEAYSFATFGGGDFGSNVHELSHTWWGGIVPNTYLKSMWNESFAEYSDDLFRRVTAPHPPATAVRGMHAAPAYGRNQLRAWPVPMATAFDTDDPQHDAAGYGKGRLVMDMLEDTIGRETLIRCMRRFRDDTKPGMAPGWPEFERAVREVTDRDYGWFFRQWVNRPGLPVVKLGAARIMPSAGAYTVTGTIEQQGAPYRLEIPVQVEDAEGTVERGVIQADAPTSSFTLHVRTRPRRIVLDPEGTILMAGGPTAGDADPFTRDL